MSHPSGNGEILTAYAQKLIAFKARQLIHSSWFTSAEREDLQQSLWLALVEQAHKFDPTRAAINTFIHHVVTTAARGLLRKRTHTHNGHSLDIPCRDEDGHTVTLAAMVDENVHGRRTRHFARSREETWELRDDVASVLNALPTEQRDLCQAMQSGQIAEIVRTESCSRTAVYRRIGRLRKRFVAAGLHEYVKKARDSSPRNRVSIQIDT